MKNYIILILLCISTTVFAGSNEAKLVCKSASGRTLFTAGLQDITSLNQCKFTIDGQSITYNENARSSIIFDGKRKVFTLTIEDKNGGWLTFYAVPSSFKTLKNTNSSQHYKFKAIIQGKDPRKGKYTSKVIELNCELTYSI